jgi:3',5'-cyclic AMP phosphodiesterase CpdA
MFTLAHLTDPHLGPLPIATIRELASKRLLGFVNWHLRRRLGHRTEIFQSLVADMKAAAPDHIALTGDLVNIALEREFVPGRAWLDMLGPPHDVTFVPGNHDIYVRATAASAQTSWGMFMRPDEARVGDNAAPVTFPFVRRRGAVTLIGLNSALPTGLFRASGLVGPEQMAALGALLPQLADTFRIVLIHHPPLGSRPRHKRLVDAAAFVSVLAEHGAELVLHGHDHLHSLHWIESGKARIPVVGVPSASAPATSRKGNPAAYNLYRIDGSTGAWRCEMISRGLRRGPQAGGDVGELARQMLLG